MEKGKTTTKQVLDRLQPVGVKKYKSFKESIEDTRKTLDKLHVSMLQSSGGNNGRK